MDKKDQRKLLDHLDTVESNLNEAEYLRRIGDEEKAQEVIQKAGVEYHRVGKEIVENTVKLINAKASNEAKVQIAELREKLAEARASGKQPSDLNVKLDILTQKIAEDFGVRGIKVSPTTIRAAALQHLEAQDINKAKASAQVSLGPKLEEAATHKEKTTADINEKAGKKADRALLMPGPTKDEYKSLKTPEDKQAYKERLTKKFADDLRGKQPVSASGGKGKSGLEAFDK